MGSHTQPVDMVGARVQNKKAADTGHGDAQYNLALMLANGLGGPVDMVGARVQYKKAADQGHMESQYSLAHMLREGEGGPVDMTEARVQYKKAADQGHVDAQYNLAHMLYEGEGGPVDMTEARVQYKKAADQGHAGCSVQPGAHALQGRGWTCRHDGSSRPIQEGSRPGTRWCSVQPGADAPRGRGWTCRHDGSSRPIQEGSRSGTRGAQYNLAQMLYEGEGGPVNLKEARVQYKKAAEQGHVAQTTWRDALRGRGWTCKHDGSARPIQEGSRPGEHAGSVQPGADALDGKGGPVDRAEAHAQYTRAADQGHSLAQDMLANILQQEETARIAFEQLMEEERRQGEQWKKKKKKREEEGEEEDGTGHDTGRITRSVDRAGRCCCVLPRRCW